MQRLRERLLKANYEAYEANLNRISQAAILTAWEKHTEDDMESKFSEIINCLKKDSTEQERHITQLHEIRQKVERALRNNVDNLITLEKRMRSLARDQQQNDFINLLVRMAARDAESMAATSDSMLQSLRIRRQENSLTKIQKYEQIADRLISSIELTGKDRELLEQEYRIVKNQLNFYLIPLKQIDALNINEISWNSQLLKNIWKTYSNGKNTIRSTSINSGSKNLNDYNLELQKIQKKMFSNSKQSIELDKTYTVNKALFSIPGYQTNREEKKKNSFNRLPEIITSDSSSDSNENKLEDETSESKFLPVICVNE